jgi:hypothetical protein
VMNLLGCLVRLFAWMPSWVSLGARSWSTGESTPSAPPLAERERRRRVREKTPQPSPTSPSAAALVRRGRNVRFASTDASAPPGSPPYEGGRERVRGGGGESPSSPSLGFQSESSAAVPARTGRGDRITAAVGRPTVAESSASVWLSKWGSAAWWGRQGLGTKWGRDRSGCG